MAPSLHREQIHQCLSHDPYPIQPGTLELIAWRRDPDWGFDCSKHWWDIRDVKTKKSIMMKLQPETRQSLEKMIAEFEDLIFDGNPTSSNPFRQMTMVI
ncbi:MAG: hypothetical protein HC921_03525 [Synechococcaceae cyanobacterium SM2_3_1]|nr:hypothetical protein [Synechococcaceae cyanobacterium SM2_3_1]